MGGGREEGAENFGQNEILYYIYQRRRPRGFAANVEQWRKKG